MLGGNKAAGDGRTRRRPGNAGNQWEEAGDGGEAAEERRRHLKADKRRSEGCWGTQAMHSVGERCQETGENFGRGRFKAGSRRGEGSSRQVMEGCLQATRLPPSPTPQVSARCCCLPLRFHCTSSVLPMRFRFRCRCRCRYRCCTASTFAFAFAFAFAAAAAARVAMTNPFIAI